jgi:hypothetical protein
MVIMCRVFFMSVTIGACMLGLALPAATAQDKPDAATALPSNEARTAFYPIQAPPDAGDDEKKRILPSDLATSLPASGENQAFAYVQSPNYSNVYLIHPAGTDFEIPVSDTFLAIVLKDRRLDDRRKAVILSSYPNMVFGTYNQTLTTYYPDASKTYETPFNPQTIAPPEGGQALIASDALAAPYVRVALVNTNGETQEFSISRAAADLLLGNPQLPPAQVLEALRNFPFRLPEAARRNFNNLTAGQLAEMIEALPDVQRQEFVRMRRVILTEFGFDASNRARRIGADVQALHQEALAPPAPPPPPPLPPELKTNRQPPAAPADVFAPLEQTPSTPIRQPRFEARTMARTLLLIVCGLIIVLLLIKQFFGK